MKTSISTVPSVDRSFIEVIKLHDGSIIKIGQLGKNSNAFITRYDYTNRPVYHYTSMIEDLTLLSVAVLDNFGHDDIFRGRLVAVGSEGIVDNRHPVIIVFDTALRVQAKFVSHENGYFMDVNVGPDDVFCCCGGMFAKPECISKENPKGAIRKGLVKKFSFSTDDNSIERIATAHYHPEANEIRGYDFRNISGDLADRTVCAGFYESNNSQHFDQLVRFDSEDLHHEGTVIVTV